MGNLRLLYIGNIGIGTTPPTAKLEVYSNLDNKILVINTHKKLGLNVEYPKQKINIRKDENI